MRIEDYFRKIQEAIEACPFVTSSAIAYDKRSAYAGFIRGEIYFLDGSILHIREFVDVESDVERLLYVYHYMDPSKRLIFRYDNTGHHRKLSLPTYPHHKHNGCEERVVASKAPDVAMVLDEIESYIFSTLFPPD